MANIEIKNGQRPGFTLLESIIVLVILGIVSAYAVVHTSMSQNEYDIRAEGDLLISILRYTQFKALSDGANNGDWVLTTASGAYFVTYDGNNSLNLPGQNANSHDLPVGMTISGGPITYDRWGSPGNSDIPLTISMDGKSRTITVSGGTGDISG